MKPNSIDSAIAAKYTGVDRDQLRYIRNHCHKCNTDSGLSFRTSVDCPLIVHNLIRAHNALDAESRSSTIVESRGFRSGQTDMDCNEIGTVGLSSDSRYSTLVWVGCEDKMTEQLSTQIIQHRHTTAANSTHVPSCFLLHRAENLLRRLGSTFLSIDREHVTAHQSLVVASILEDMAKFQVEYQTADQIKRQLIGRPSRSDSQTILMLAWRRHDVDLAAVIRDIYASVKRYEPCVLRVFPSEEELEHAHGKIGDILALDEVAQRAPVGWSFRPVTCDCTSACRLREAGVLKRTHSCGSEHVIVRPTASDVSRHLKCTAHQRRRSERKAAQSRERWFHQEFVEGLRSIGEFRIFIVTVADAAAMRGRRAEVMEVVHTIELKDRELVVTVLTSDPVWSGRPHTYSETNIQELKMFALYVFNALRGRADWSTNFESLEVGARVDVGVTILGGSCHYFVNEVTRIYEADYFAEWLAQPGTHICRAVSTALEEIFVDYRADSGTTTSQGHLAP